MRMPPVEPSGLPAEPAQVNLFWANAWVEPFGFDLLSSEQRLECVAQGFATLIKSFTHQVFKDFHVVCRVWQGGVRR